MKSSEKPLVMVAASDRAKIDRNVLKWLNTCDIVKENVAGVLTESQLGSNEPGMGVSKITNAFVSKSYIYGGYQAEYQFTLIYRIKPGGSPDKSLQANEVLNRIGDWAMENFPDLGEGITVQRVRPTSIAETYANYDDGDEDHHIEIKIIYEVI